MALENFGMIIPNGPVLRDDGKPAAFVKYKEEWIAHLNSSGRLEEVQNMTWAEKDEEYLAWEKAFVPKDL